MFFSVLTGVLFLGSSFIPLEELEPVNFQYAASEDLQIEREVLKILQTKCNVCHQRQNPFMVFKEQNISRRAGKIYQMVFIERSMPKGTDYQLTEEEYSQLKNWLLKQKIN
ncbi:MAG: hypothetical protein NXH89_00025 [Cyclobacteriaceae bacterium]|nr:hypothetical protein [Cyclobacteriaceae bacterium]